MSTDTVYSELLTHLNRIHRIDSVASLLGWDEQVNLPADSADLRAEQNAVMAELAHEAAGNPRVGELLKELAKATVELSADQQVVVREARKDYDRATKLPAEFVREKATQASVGYHAWAKARAAADFAGYAPVLAKNITMAKQEATYLGWGDRPYDYMIDLHDPGMSAAVIDKLFSELKVGLVPLVQQITSSCVKPRNDVLVGFSVEGQLKFLREVTEKLGFNYRRGRIDVSLHPFCSGNGADIRMTTRFKEDEPLSSLFGSIHETGHGLYEQGLPQAHHATALGRAAGMGVHESQSRMWENQVGRSRAFWQYFEPRFRETFPAQTSGVSSDELYLAVNKVAPTLIRVEADEITYNLHIILRFEIEQQLFAGTLAVADLPRAWNDAAQAMLGLTPANDREGVLQDVHWSGGAFGYFPSYCLGNMIAAQLWYFALTQRPTLMDEFARGDFTWLLKWLQTNVHAEGKRYDALTLTKRITGEELSPQPLLRYLRERYLPLYCA
ncbi:MAG: carboxypeptidase M32 [Cephaloticoccus sp.]|nr:carboxypeptidase M32 [Cephaloticoccus sp.]MCF7760208.1 carboxypeptidase M32 [Cephaloticoccus sp.]